MKWFILATLGVISFILCDIVTKLFVAPVAEPWIDTPIYDIVHRLIFSCSLLFSITFVLTLSILINRSKKAQ
ncbi:hypothetical protein Rhal01_03710 [Rubritalea halochordaticola]|uniref:Uncharacterized protein n=1 Tax=Rubritalea halochordaticola TaxID=714537 RepID=A0ABP9V6I9_9BACT